MATWPAGLPQKPEWTGYQRTYKPGGTERFEPDAGPTVIRTRSTSQPKRSTWSFVVETIADLETFEAFYETTLNYGSAPIDLEDPISGASSSFIVVSNPVSDAIGGTAFRISFQVEKVMA